MTMIERLRTMNVLQKNSAKQDYVDMNGDGKDQKKEIISKKDGNADPWYLMEFASKNIRDEILLKTINEEFKKDNKDLVIYDKPTEIALTENNQFKILLRGEMDKGDGADGLFYYSDTRIEAKPGSKIIISDKIYDFEGYCSIFAAEGLAWGCAAYVKFTNDPEIEILGIKAKVSGMTLGISGTIYDPRIKSITFSKTEKINILGQVLNVDRLELSPWRDKGIKGVEVAECINNPSLFVLPSGGQVRALKVGYTDHSKFDIAGVEFIPTEVNLPNKQKVVANIISYKDDNIDTVKVADQTSIYKLKDGNKVNSIDEMRYRSRSRSIISSGIVHYQHEIRLLNPVYLNIFEKRVLCEERININEDDTLAEIILAENAQLKAINGKMLDLPKGTYVKFDGNNLVKKAWHSEKNIDIDLKDSVYIN